MFQTNIDCNMNILAPQDELVKLQLLSLAMKLSLTQPDTLPVCKYVLSLARYDASYDVRDRARMLRRFVEPEPTSLLARYAAYIFCPDKPKPIVHSNYKGKWFGGWMFVFFVDNCVFIIIN